MSNPNRHNTKRFADGGYTQDNPGGFSGGNRRNDSMGGYRNESDLISPTGGYTRSQRGVRYEDIERGARSRQDWRESSEGRRWGRNISDYIGRKNGGKV